MRLLILLSIPIIVAAAAFFILNKKLKYFEILVQVLVGMSLMYVGYICSKYAKTADVEIWNGRIVKKSGKQHCCHSYSCNCSTSCSTDLNNNYSCHEECDTCFRHINDLYWTIETTNGEVILDDTCNSPHSNPPRYWEIAKNGEPSAVEHSHINYIKGAPGSFFKRPWLISKYKDRLPQYPRVYDRYKIDRFLLSSVGEELPNLAGLNEKLSVLNAGIGKLKQVNIIVVLTAEKSSEYAEAISESWLGGKKNDLIVVIGVPEFPRIAWTKVISWTDSSSIKSGIEKRTLEMEKFDGYKLLSMIEQEVIAKFNRKHMRDFRYLLNEIEPPNWAFGLLIFLGLLVSSGIQVWFWRKSLLKKDYKWGY